MAFDDFGDITQPLHLFNPKKAIKERAHHIATEIKNTRPEWHCQPSPEAYTQAVVDLAKMCLDRGIPLMVLDVLIPKAESIEQMGQQLPLLKRMVPRETQDVEITRSELQGLLKHQSHLWDDQPDAYVTTNFNIITQEVNQKRINNRDFAAYVEKVKSLEELRKMCVRARDRRNS